MKPFVACAALAAFALSGAAQAQTCASPLFFMADSLGNPMPIYGNTCSASNSFPILCGVIDGVENDIVVQLTIPAPYTHSTVTVTPTTPGWDPILISPSGSCDSNNFCDADSDSGTSSTPESITLSGSGTHYLVITTSPYTLPSCGTFIATRIDH